MDPYTGDEELDALVAERMATLAPEVMRVFDDPASSIYIESFAASAGLSGEQADSLKHEIMLMMLGFTQPDDFSFVLMTELEMPPRQAFAVEHWVKGVFLKEVLLFVEPQAEIAAPQPEIATSHVELEASSVPEATQEMPQEIVQEATVTQIQAEAVSAPVPTQETVSTFAPAPILTSVSVPIAPTPLPVPASVAPIEEQVSLVPAALPIVQQATPPPMPLQPIVVPILPKPAVSPISVEQSHTAVLSPVSVAIAAPPLPRVATPLPLPVKLAPAVPSIASGATSIALARASAHPHTMLEDVVRARGAITPAGIARYDQPLAPVPAYVQ